VNSFYDVFLLNVCVLFLLLHTIPVRFHELVKKLLTIAILIKGAYIHNLGAITLIFYAFYTNCS